MDRTSAGVRIQVRMVGVKNTPRRVSSTPQHRAKAMSVCTAERTQQFLAPKCWAMTMPAPDEQAHKKACHHKNEVAAAGHSGQSLLAHKFAHDDTVHRVLYSCWQQIAQKTGTAKLTMRFQMEPVVMTSVLRCHGPRRIAFICKEIVSFFIIGGKCGKVNPSSPK